MKIVIPCLSACLFNFNPAVLASSKVVLRLWECFFNAIVMSKWHLHFIILYTVGKKRELTYETPWLLSRTKQLLTKARPRKRVINLHRLVVHFEKYLPKQLLMHFISTLLKYSHVLSYFLSTHTTRTSVPPPSKCFWAGNHGLSFYGGP